jgi:threonine dehydrogenase-like Zn-dependent dehydrogenase
MNMDTLVWTGPRAMEMRPAPEPVPGPGEALIEVEAAGICGSELSGYLGKNKLRVPPLVMGHEAAGRIARAADALMADGARPREGLRVTFNPLVTCGRCDRCAAGLTNLCRERKLIGAHRPGAFARFVAVPAAQCLPLPEGLSAAAGSLTEPLACSLRASRLAGAGRGRRLLILGAGPIGLLALAAAREAGAADVWITDVADSRLDTARRWGAKGTVNAKSTDVVAAVKEAVPGGVEAAIDAVGSDETRSQAIQSVMPGGRVVFIGLHEEESKIPANLVVRNEVAVTGSFGYTGGDFADALGMLARGVVKAGPDWIEERPLARGPESFAELVDGRCRAAKIILHVA